MHDFIEWLRELVEFTFNRGWAAAERHYGHPPNERTVAGERALYGHNKSHVAEVMADLYDHAEREMRPS